VIVGYRRKSAGSLGFLKGLKKENKERPAEGKKPGGMGSRKPNTSIEFTIRRVRAKEGNTKLTGSVPAKNREKGGHRQL